MAATSVHGQAYLASTLHNLQDAVNDESTDPLKDLKAKFQQLKMKNQQSAAKAVEAQTQGNLRDQLAELKDLQQTADLRNENERLKSENKSLENVRGENVRLQRENEDLKQENSRLGGRVGKCVTRIKEDAVKFNALRESHETAAREILRRDQIARQRGDNPYHGTD